MDKLEFSDLIKETALVSIVIILFTFAAIGIFCFYVAPLWFKIPAGIVYVGLGVLCMYGHVKDIIEHWKTYKKDKEHDTEI